MLVACTHLLEIIPLLEQRDAVAGVRERVRSREPADATPDDDDVQLQRGFATIIEFECLPDADSSCCRLVVVQEGAFGDANTDVYSCLLRCF